jgi:cell division initiation protein
MGFGRSCITEMRLSPIDIRQYRFNTRFRGFDPREVEVFLESVVADFEAVVRENSELRRELERLARELESYRGRERVIQETLTTAQTVVDELRRTAVKESEVVITSAEMRAEQLLRQAEEQRAELAREIAELRHVRSRVEADVRKTLEGYLSLVDGFREGREARANGARRALDEHK